MTDGEKIHAETHEITKYVCRLFAAVSLGNIMSVNAQWNVKCALKHTRRTSFGNGKLQPIC